MNLNPRYSRRSSAVCHGLSVALLLAGCSDSEEEAKRSPDTAETTSAVEQRASVDDGARESPSSEQAGEAAGRSPASRRPVMPPPEKSAELPGALAVELSIA